MTLTRLKVQPIDEDFSLKSRIYASLKRAIVSADIYDDATDLRLDERKLSEQFGISRTPLREALARLEQERLVKIMPRRGVFIARRTKAEIVEMITVWAALESMAARLATLHASDAEIANLRTMTAVFENRGSSADIDEYSIANIKFHQAILKLGKSPIIEEIAEGLFMHVRTIRSRTISEGDRFNRSIIDHMHIIEALEARDTELVERLVREHTLNLAAHVEKNVTNLD
jgi:DNA-binding GntR family transcriptional regulator